MNVIDLENKFTEMLNNVMNEDAAETLAQAVSETSLEEFQKGQYGEYVDEDTTADDYDDADWKAALSDAVVSFCKNAE